MILLILLAATVIWVTIATVLEVRRDGYRQQPTDWNRVAQHEPELTRANR